MREKSSSFSVIPLQRKASSWIIRRYVCRTSRSSAATAVARLRSSRLAQPRPSSDSAHMAIEASGLLISCATPAARKPTLASCSLRTTCLVRCLDLAIEVVANLLKAGRHVVHRLGQAPTFRLAVSRRMR